MKHEIVQKLHKNFNDYAQKTENGLEFWFARDLQALLGYVQWKNFQKVIERAKIAAQTASLSVADHFADAGKMVLTGSGAKREIDDIALTRHACYLIAQNGDPRKEEIAFAMAYFAIQTRKQELVEKRIPEMERLGFRENLTNSEKELSGIIYERGVDNMGFARIVPENLPPEEDIKKVERRLKSEDRKFLKGSKKK